MRLLCGRKYLKGMSYYWERRNIVKRVLKNRLARALGEPFRPKGRNGETVIVFVRTNARGRGFNLGYSLRGNHRLRTILITKAFEYKFQKQAFDEIHVFSNFAHLVRLVERLGQKYKILAVIGMTQPARQTHVLIEMSRDWPVLIDQYDSEWALSYFAGVDPADLEVNGFLADEVAEEEHCYRQADGVIARSGELQVLFKEQGVRTPMLLIQDGCNPRFFQPLTSRSGPKGAEWSVVYPGIFHPMSHDSRIVGDTQFVPMGKTFAEERIHFHLYPSPHHNYQYPEYEAEAARNPYFHLHEAVDFDKIGSEITQYDFGWDVKDRSKFYGDSKVYYQHVVSNKTFLFLDAGLPQITEGRLARVEQILRQTGAGIILRDYASKGLREVIEMQDMPGLIRGVERARAELDINRRSEELLAFIQEVRQRYEKTRR